jgi:hypothetical protein
LFPLFSGFAVAVYIARPVFPAKITVQEINSLIADYEKNGGINQYSGFRVGPASIQFVNYIKIF